MSFVVSQERTGWCNGCISRRHHPCGFDCSASDADFFMIKWKAFYKGSLMNKRILLGNLKKAAEWVAAKQRDHDQAVNVMVGFFQILRQAGQHDTPGWLNRKHQRRRVLANIRDSDLLISQVDSN